MKNNRIFAVNYIRSGGAICLFVAGIFYAQSCNIQGPVPPCGALMRPLPLRCSSTGKAGPFFIPADKHFLSGMNYTEKCLNGKITSDSNRNAHDTGTSNILKLNQEIQLLKQKLEVEKNAKNHAFFYVLSRGLLSDYYKEARKQFLKHYDNE